MPNSAIWHCSKTQVLCGFEPNSAISLSQAAQCLGTQVALWGGGYGRACADSQRTSTPKARKSFVHLFKGGGVWGETPRPYRGAGAKPPPSHTQKKGGRMSPSWDSTKAVAPGPEKLKWRSCPKTQETCGFRQLSQLGVVAIFPPKQGGT